MIPLIAFAILCSGAIALYGIHQKNLIWFVAGFICLCISGYAALNHKRLTLSMVSDSTQKQSYRVNEICLEGTTYYQTAYILTPKIINKEFTEC